MDGCARVRDQRSTSASNKPDLLIRCRNNGSDGAAKLLAVTGVVLALSIIAQVVWAFTARLLLSARGLPVSSLGADAAHFWSDVLGVQVRAALLTLPCVWLGFGLANLIRNTAAALGIAFIYFAVLESVLRSISPSLQPYIFVTSIAALATKGGVTVFGRDQG